MSTGPDPPPSADRPIRTDERSGVLHPGNLERYGARFTNPDPAVCDVVERYWHVRWHLRPGEVIAQRIIAAPAVNLTIEAGDVPAPLVVTGVHRRAWMREIAGSGSVFGIRLRPAGLAVLSDLTPDRIADATLPLEAGLDVRLHDLLSGIAASTTPEARAVAADEAITALRAERPPGPQQLLANAVLDELSARVRSRAGPVLAARFGVSQRALQRALSATLGHGPKWTSRWIRLQEVARALATEQGRDVSTLAADLGYADQAHLVNDFRRAVGTTPGAYVRSLQALTGA